MKTFPVLPAHQLVAVEPEHRWLIEHLWSDQSVGILGGEPKSCKSFLALGMAVSVASGRPCLDRFAVKRTGRVLFFAAEDALHVVRERLDGIAVHLGLDLADLDLWVITAPSVRLDVAEDCRRLAATVAELEPVLLILDPFVRLHRVDESVSSAVAPLLAFLREIQRSQGCAVCVVHHARKGANKLRPGQALRGTSEFHAWYDVGLFVKRCGDQLMLSIEHRAHPSSSGIPLSLAQGPSSLALVAAHGPCREGEPGPAAPRAASDKERVIEALGSLARPVRIRELREHCRMRTKTVCNAIQELAGEGLVIETADGWKISAPTSSTSTSTGLRGEPPEQTLTLFPTESSL